MEEGTFGPLLHAKFHPHRCNVSPLRGEQPQNRPLSKLNTGRFALRAMLPVKTCAFVFGQLLYRLHVSVVGSKSTRPVGDFPGWRRCCDTASLVTGKACIL